METRIALSSKRLHEIREALRCPGERVKLLGGAGSRNWWTVQAASQRFTILTVPEPFKPAGTVGYTIIDWETQWRGPCNLIGQGWGDGTYSRQQCEELLKELEAGEVEVSHRNRVSLTFGDLHRAASC